MSLKALEQKITDLQIKYTFQEQLIEDLNKVVTEQNYEIELLKKRIELIQEKQNMMGDFSQEVVDSRPPHY